jgi:hypothetical protein
MLLRHEKGVLSVVALGLVAAVALGQNSNQIIAVSPVSAAQGVSGLTVAFTLDTDAPPAPPPGVPPASVTLGALTGSSVTHTNQYTVTD